MKRHRSFVNSSVCKRCSKRHNITLPTATETKFQPTCPALVVDGEMKYDSQCSACVIKKNCDHSLMQYLPEALMVQYSDGSISKSMTVIFVA